MNRELIFSYHKGKIYFRYSIPAFAILSVLYGMWILPQWNTIILILFFVFIAIFISYFVYTVKKIKSLDFYIKCDTYGIYTKECFEYCSYKNIVDIELKRYLGYQTLFFEVKNDDLKAKIKPIKTRGKTYYCLPLADCAGDPKNIYMEVLDYFTIYHKQ